MEMFSKAKCNNYKIPKQKKKFNILTEVLVYFQVL